MRLLICVPLFLAACSAGNDDAGSDSLISKTGRLESKKLVEVSGLARSNRSGDVYWSMNDDGAAAIYALDGSGRHLGRVHVDDAKNRDWEDMASFTLDDTAYLIIADIGDNDSRHKHVSLYVIEEPDPKDDAATIAWQIDFRYPDGPRDAESLAVDAQNEHIYVLSKRTIPTELYRLPLQPDTDNTIFAQQVAVLDKLQNPTRNKRGQRPTAMDFAPDGSSALILTYAGVNYYSRAEGQSWPDALQGQTMHLALGNFKDAESISYSDDSKAAVVTAEGKHAPVLRIELLLQ